MQLISATEYRRLAAVALAMFVATVGCASCEWRQPTAADLHIGSVAIRGYAGVGDSPRDSGGSSDAITSATKYYVGPMVNTDISTLITASGGMVVTPVDPHIVFPDRTMIASGDWPDKCTLLVYRWTSTPDNSWTLSAKQRTELQTGSAEVIKLAVTCG